MAIVKQAVRSNSFYYVVKLSKKLRIEKLQFFTHVLVLQESIAKVLYVGNFSVHLHVRIGFAPAIFKVHTSCGYTGSSFTNICKIINIKCGL